MLYLGWITKQEKKMNELQEGLKRNLQKAIGKEVNVRVDEDVSSVGILLDINDSAIMIDEPPYITLIPVRNIKILRIRNDKE